MQAKIMKAEISIGKIECEYRDVFYIIENHENGSNYEVYEYSPIFGKKVEIMFGSSCERTYTTEYVENLIDEGWQALQKARKIERAWQKGDETIVE